MTRREASEMLYKIINSGIIDGDLEEQLQDIAENICGDCFEECDGDGFDSCYCEGCIHLK